MGGDAQSRTTRNDANFVVLSLATKRSWKDRQSGEWKSQTTWLRCLVFGRAAEFDREQLILSHLPHVELLARRLNRRCPQVELADLIGVGTIGLIQAIDRFDPSRNLKVKIWLSTA